jgi:hypothetical protein
LRAAFLLSAFCALSLYEELVIGTQSSRKPSFPSMNTDAGSPAWLL